VASHLRCAHRGGFTTVTEHLSAAHLAHLARTSERMIHCDSSIGVATGPLVRRFLETRKHPEHGYRARLGLLALFKRFSKPLLEAAYNPFDAEDGRAQMCLSTLNGSTTLRVGSPHWGT
jgi:hypothetical protein